MRQVDADIAISLIQKDKIEGETLNIIKALGDGLQAETLNQACDRHIKIINSLPTIEVEPKHAYVIIDEDGNMECSNCGSSNCFDNYCGTCGAKLIGTRKDDEENG